MTGMVCSLLLMLQQRPMTLIKASEKLLEEFELWTWRRMLKFSCTEKVTNKEVLVHANEAIEAY